MVIEDDQCFYCLLRVKFFRMTTSDGLWNQLGASELIESCGPEIAEVLHQVDMMVEAKRSEWEAQYNKAVQNVSAWFSFNLS